MAEREDVLPLGDVLDVVQQFGLASLGLVAWDLCVSEEALVPAWRQAIGQRLIEAVGRCPLTREQMYRVVETREDSLTVQVG